MKLAEYLSLLDSDTVVEDQSASYEKIRSQCTLGLKLLNERPPEDIQAAVNEFFNRTRTEELKAWYGSPENGSIFQGTSVSALTIPAEYTDPLRLSHIEMLENNLAEAYIAEHDKYEESVRNAIIENIDEWASEGLYYGVVIASKIISQAFGLTVPENDVVFDVDGVTVDPHEITSYPERIRDKYFQQAVKKIECFGDLDISRQELEMSLILADISKPKIELYKSRILLAPVRCNEIASIISKRVNKLIIEKTSGRISPRSLNIVIYDTDTPYTYHQLIECHSKIHAPILPGLTILGSSGSIDAFKWLYAYRVSLIAQKIQKNSLCSEVSRTFIPFVFFGVLVPRDAKILLDMNNLGNLRYRGNIDPEMEFLYLLPMLLKYIKRDKNMCNFAIKLHDKLM
jgi:hypothetical protein